MELNDKILKAISEDLPAITAGELKKFIDEANQVKKDYEVAKKCNEESVALLKQYKAIECKFDSVYKKEQDTIQLLKSIEEKERKLALDIKDEQIKQRDFVINKFEGFLNNLVKNPRAIELISEHANIPVYETHVGGGGHHTTQPKCTSGTREKTETKD